MKILVVCQYYYPEPFRISDICEELVKAGHEVFVITGIPNYPEGKIHKGYRFFKRRNEVIKGVRVHRCFTIGRRHGTIFRLLNYYSYAVSSTLYSLMMREHFDAIFVNQLSPVMMAKAAIAYKNKYKTKLVLYCLDLWPASLSIGGVQKDTVLYKYFHKVSSRIYSAADTILVSSKSFSEYFQNEFGIVNTQYLPQYAEEVFDFKKCYKKPNDTVDLMFAGNVGSAQSVETIIYAADKTRKIDNLYWHIVGEGSKLENIIKLSNSLSLKNVIFHGRQSVENMPKYYSMADAMIVTMKKNDIISKTLPGKVQGYMAAGKPILGAIDGETANIIEESNCGICCPAEDYDGLAEIALKFIRQIPDSKYSEHSLAYYNSIFSKQTVINTLVDFLEK